jgi:tetratricopeptide (TPR) repeat protein
VQGNRTLSIAVLLSAFGCAQRAAAPSRTPVPALSASSAVPQVSAPRPSPAEARAPQSIRIEVRVPAGLDSGWLGSASLAGLVTIERAAGQVVSLAELYDDPQARGVYVQQPPGVTLAGQPDAVQLFARFGAWWQGGEFLAPPLTSVRLGSLRGLDSDQSRALVRLFVETHVHESHLWLTDPTSLSSALAAAKSVADDPRAQGDCRLPCVPWPWQTRWSVLELSGRAAWREGDATRDTQLLDSAIARIQEALRAIPRASHPLTAAVTERLLAVALQSRAQLDPELRGLEDGLAASERAVAAFATPATLVDRSFTMSNLQEQLRFLGRRDALKARYDQALASSNEVLQVLDVREGPLAYARALLSQAEVLQDEYESLDDRPALAAARDRVLQALTLVPRDASPLLTQRLYGALCRASSELGAVTGDVAELEKGVQACELALALAPEVEEPRPALTVTYGLALCRLGDARSDVGTLRRAVAQIRTSLAKFDAHTQPVTRAKALNNLGIALRVLSSREDQQKNLELSGSALEESLALSPKRSAPVNWGRNKLGLAESERRLGWVARSRFQMDAAKTHYDRALRAVDDALTVLNQKNQPQLWASAQERAGDILAREGEIAEQFHFNQAVARYQLALRVNRRAVDSAAYARTQFGLGVAYLFWADQSSGLDHIRSIAKKSVAAFREALAIRAELGLLPLIADTKAHLADAVSIVDRVSYRSTCEPRALLEEAVHDDAQAMGLWEPAAASLERYEKSAAQAPDKCGTRKTPTPPLHK